MATCEALTRGEGLGTMTKLGLGHHPPFTIQPVSSASALWSVFVVLYVVLFSCKWHDVHVVITFCVFDCAPSTINAPT
jgi:hypothetical protein